MSCCSALKALKKDCRLLLTAGFGLDSVESMKTFVVARKEVHISYVEIDAETPEEAEDKVAQGEGEEILCEYDYTLPQDRWGDVSEK